MAARLAAWPVPGLGQVPLEAWFERWLYGVRNGVENEPAVRTQTNDNEWHLQETWGDSDNDVSGINLLDGPKTFSYFDDGALTESEMLRGTGQGSRYLRVKVPHSSGIRIEGRPVLNLRASSDSASTHLIAILCDVAPTGGCKVVSRAFLNARYNDSFTKGKDLEPGKKYTFRLEFIDKDHVVAKDHHLELIIASSSNIWVAPDERRATNTFYLHESSLDIPRH